MKVFFTILLFAVLIKVYPSKQDTLGPYYKYYNAFQPKLLYEYSGQHALGVGVTNMMYLSDYITELPILFHGGFLDVGLVFKQPKPLLLNKIGYEFFFLVGGGKLSLVNYSDLKENKTYLRPEVGLTFFSYVSLTYGYNVSLKKARPFGIGKNMVSLSIGKVIDKKPSYYY